MPLDLLQPDSEFVKKCKEFEGTLFASSYLTKDVVDDSQLQKITDCVIFFKKHATKGVPYQNYMLSNNFHLLVEGYFSYFAQKANVSPLETQYILESVKFLANLVASNEENKEEIFKRLSSWLILQKCFLLKSAALAEVSIVLLFNLLQHSAHRQEHARSNDNFYALLKAWLYCVSCNSQISELWHISCDFAVFLVKSQIICVESLLNLVALGTKNNDKDSIAEFFADELMLFMTLFLESNLSSYDDNVCEFLEAYLLSVSKSDRSASLAFFSTHLHEYSLYCEVARISSIRWSALLSDETALYQFILYLKSIFLLTFEPNYDLKFNLQSNLLIAFAHIIDACPLSYLIFIECTLLPLILLCTITSDVDCTRRESAVVFIKCFLQRDPQKNAPLLEEIAKQNKIRIPL